ncbi:hypothetical protein BDQ17DRAFT_1234978 [Cyathus striatus]|nr:hypothetical protein BDQ17DRAFT_1234978 [Cyathus striatus]
MSSRSLISIGLPKDTLSALAQCGYETFQDLEAATAEDLAKELNITNNAAEKIINVVHITPTVPLTQSGAALMNTSCRFPTKIPSIDRLLRGGLLRGHILEVTGVPGSPKETAALGIMTSFVEVDEEVLFVDCQNMVPCAKLKHILSSILTKERPESLALVHYMKIHTMADLMVFIQRLPLVLEAHQKVKLLIIASVSFPFQYPNLTLTSRNALLDTVKQALTKACTFKNLTIVTTSQLATKLLKADGTPGTFDTGAKGIMVPQLGPAYLPSGRTYRVILSRVGPTSGYD